MLDDLFLNLKSRTRMTDFLSNWFMFASPEIREKAEVLIADYDDGNPRDADEMAEAVREFAIDIWPKRYAINRFFSEEGGLIEWDKVENAVRRSTAHFMERFRKTTDCRTLDDLFASEDFDSAFGDEERAEIEQVRHHVREDFALTHKKNLEELIEEGEEMLKHFTEKILQLREIAEGLPTLLQEECYSKITRFEDRCLFKGERLDVGVMEEEILYYKDQEEIPIEEKGS